MTTCIRTLLAGAAIVPVAAAMLSTTVHAQASRDFEIGAGPLEAGLVVYARQSGVQLLYTADLVAGLRTPGINGRFEPDAALDRLLSGSGIGWTRSRPGVVAVVHMPEGFTAAFARLLNPLCQVEVREARLIRPDLPVALASGYVTAEIEQAALAEGAQALIHKPNDVEELCATVQRLIVGHDPA